MQVLILAGGNGKRLWPLSNKNMPKQFLKLSQLGKKSLFQKTILRAKKIVSLDNIFIIVSNNIQKTIAITQLNELKLNFSDKKIIVGPNKDTLGAIIFGMSYSKDYTLIMPADHIIKNESNFFDAVPKAKKFAKSSLVIFGIKPTKPHTGYGYIKSKPNNIHEVEKFVEKPNKAKAKKYVEQNYLWNSGIFLFRKNIFFDELKKENPNIFNFYFNSELKKIYKDAKEISVDYALLEKSKNIKVVKIDIKWLDVGNFDSISESNVACVDSNQGSKKTTFFDATNNLVQDRESKEVILGFVDDLIVINTKDTLLITKKGKSENIKEIVNELENIKKEKKRKKAKAK